MTTTVSDLIRRLFRQTRSNVIIAGVNARARLLAAEIAAAGREVSLVDLGSGLGDMNEAVALSVLNEARARAAKCLLAATSNSEVNLRLCRIARDRFGVPDVIARLGWSESVSSWARVTELKTERLGWAETANAALDGVTPTEAFRRVAWAADGELVTDVELRSPVFAGRKTCDLPVSQDELIAVWRHHDRLADFETAKLELGDTLTLVGTTERIKALRERLASV